MPAASQFKRCYQSACSWLPQISSSSRRKWLACIAWETPSDLNARAALSEVWETKLALAKKGADADLQASVVLALLRVTRSVHLAVLQSVTLLKLTSQKFFWSVIFEPWDPWESFLLMGSAASVEGAASGGDEATVDSVGPVPQVVLLGVQARVSALELECIVPVEALAPLKSQLSDALAACPAGCEIGAEAGEAVRRVAELCIALAAEAGLTSVGVVELLAEGLSAAASLLSGSGFGAEVMAVLEPLGSALDGFAVQILANLWRLEGPVQPEWSMERFAKPGILCFADTTQPFCKHALDLRLYQALQAVCIWILALLFRAIGHSPGASNLWEFCNADALCATILVKGALSFQRGRRETSCVRVPHDLAQLQKAILSSALGLSHPSLVFDGDSCDLGDVGIEERQEQLLSHCALLAAVASENELLDSLLSFGWAEAADLVPVLAAHLAVMASSTQLVLPHLEDAASNYLRHLKLRSSILWGILLLETSPGRGFLRDCAQLAFHVAPSPEAARSLVSRVKGDALAVAFSCALLANAGLGPNETAETPELLSKLSVAMRGQAKAQLEITSFWRKEKAMDKNARDWQMGTDLANEGSRLWGKMQGYIQGHTPLDTERHCTDCLFIPLFLAAIVGLCLCINNAMEKGSFQRLTSLPDFEGHLCGTGGQGQYVYFCQQGGTLDLQHQICVPSCPVDSSTQIFCRGTGTNQPSYATHPVAGMVCMPAAAEVASQVKHLFDSNPYLKTLFELVEVTFDWEQLIVAAVVASIVSYLYLFCISLCASFLVWLCLIALVVLPTCLGLVYVYMSASPEIIVPNSFPAMITSGDTRNDLTVGLSLCGVGGLLACVAMVKAKTIQAAVVSIEEAADCIRQMPVLAVEPWISVVIKLLFFVPGMLGLLMLNVSGDLPSHVDFSQGQPVYSGDPMVAISLVYYFVVFVWIMELLHSVSQFVVMFTAQVWFFRMKGYETSFWAHFTAYDMLLGFVYGLGYHLGSLLYGSFLCTLFRVARIFASLLMHASQNSGNPVAECVAKCFVCCLSCAEKLMQYVTSMAYCDIVMNSTTYCEGAEHAVQIVSGNASQLVAVEGLATMFSFVGVGVSSAATAGICWFLSTTFSRYSSPVSDHYVPDKQTMVICAAVIGAVMAADDWLSLFGLEPKEAEPKKPEPERCTGGRMRAPGLRDLMSDVPKEFCCALDGRLLVDPVRTPGGHVYERSVLAKALAEGDPRVLSDSPYTLQDCQRDAGLRARIVDWVRSNHSQSKEKRSSGFLVLMHRESPRVL
eukprot:s3560_g12.t5